MCVVFVFVFWFVFGFLFVFVWVFGCVLLGCVSLVFMGSCWFLVVVVVSVCCVVCGFHLSAVGRKNGLLANYLLRKAFKLRARDSSFRALFWSSGEKGR